MEIEMNKGYKTLRNMTDAEIGALVRAKNEGKVIEVVDTVKGAWVPAPAPSWHPRSTYRVRLEPKREIERVTIVNADGVTIGIGTVVCEDGRPDCGSVKMEPL
jgi:hypothetical protein